MQEVNLHQYVDSFKKDFRLGFFKSETLIEKHGLKPLDLSLITIRILVIISGQKQIYQNEILQFVPTTAANLSQRLVQMEKNKWIKRILESNKADRRKVYIQITPAGRKLAKKAIKRILIIKTMLSQGISQKEMDQFMLTMQKYSANADKVEQILVGKNEDIFKGS